MKYILLDTNIVIDMVIDRRKQVSDTVLSNFIKLLDYNEIKLIVPEIVKVETYRHLEEELTLVGKQIKIAMKNIDDLYGITTYDTDSLDIHEYKKHSKQELTKAYEKYNKNEKELRPFIGILFKIEMCEYFAPLSSPKPKHKNMKNTLDFFKIKNGELGAVNFNNMIPVNKNNYSLVDLNKETLTISELKYQKLLREQLAWLNANYQQVKNKFFKLYQLYNEGRLPQNIKLRCCNFKLLEEKCTKYNMDIN